MVAFSKRNLTKKYPKPSACIIEMIQLVLQVNSFVSLFEDRGCFPSSIETSRRTSNSFYKTNRTLWFAYFVQFNQLFHTEFNSNRDSTQWSVGLFLRISFKGKHCLSLLNRWSLNLALAIIDDVLCCKSNLNSEDLVLVITKSIEVIRMRRIFLSRLMKCLSVHLYAISFSYFSSIIKMK